mmetsp:Transcript_10961/g.29714  ORF Transcript_10961/g.29714 Transcript_10961/m.29714 type:complete len:273 (+) Transcript_10961:1869-2687(+)
MTLERRGRCRRGCAHVASVRVVLCRGRGVFRVTRAQQRLWRPQQRAAANAASDWAASTAGRPRASSEAPSGERAKKRLARHFRVSTAYPEDGRGGAPTNWQPVCQPDHSLPDVQMSRQGRGGGLGRRGATGSRRSRGRSIEMAAGGCFALVGVSRDAGRGVRLAAWTTGQAECESARPVGRAAGHGPPLPSSRPSPTLCAWAVHGEGKRKGAARTPRPSAPVRSTRRVVLCVCVAPSARAAREACARVTGGSMRGEVECAYVRVLEALCTAL